MKKLTFACTVLAMVCVLGACSRKTAMPETTAALEAAETAQLRGVLESKKDFMITVMGEDGKPHVFLRENVACPAEKGDRVLITYTGDPEDFDSQLVAVKIEKL